MNRHIGSLTLTLAIALGAILLAAPARAQTPHPCDAVPPSPTPTAAPIGAGFCHDGKTTTGTATTITKFLVTVDGIKVFEGPLTPIGPPSAAGLSYYETPKNIIPTVGAHKVVVRAYNSAGAGVASAELPFEILESTPAEVTGVRIIR